MTAAELLAIDWTAPIRFRTGRHPFDDGLTEDPRSGTVDNPVLDVAGLIVRRVDRYFMTPDQGPEYTDYGSYPVVVDVPLVHVVPELHALMTAMVALRPEHLDTVRVVYAWDQE